MNDFTLEELEDLAIALLYSGWTQRMNCKNTIELKAKILSMVDNYCEHEKYTFMENLCDVDILLCNVCEKIFIR